MTDVRTLVMLSDVSRHLFVPIYKESVLKTALIRVLIMPSSKASASCLCRLASLIFRLSFASALVNDLIERALQKIKVCKHLRKIFAKYET